MKMLIKPYGICSKIALGLILLLIPIFIISSCGGGGGGGDGSSSSSKSSSPAYQAFGLEKKWDFPTGKKVYSSPSSSPDGGTIYVGSNDSYLYALTADGRLLWKYQTGGEVFSSPAVGADGTVYVGSLDEKLYAVDSNGRLKWSYSTKGMVFSSPAIDESSGTIYIGSSDGYLYALDLDSGRKKWSVLLEGTVSSPAVGPDGTIFVGSGQLELNTPTRSVGKLYALDPEDGHKRWTGTIAVFSRPAVDSGGWVYAASTDGCLYALETEEDGSMSVRWQYQTGGAILSCPTLGPDGNTVYVGSDSGRLYALRSTDGWLRWAAATGGKIRSSATVGPGGLVYVGCHDGCLYAFGEREGSLKGVFPTVGGEPIVSIPLIGNDGTIYFSGQDSRVYALLQTIS